MINVTKSYLPPLEEYIQYLHQIWDKSWLTNQGPLVQELEQKLQKYLGVEHLLFVSNGTIAIQLAIKALELTGEIITTPFSYVATTNSLLWENCQPVFADIESTSCCINPHEIEKLINEKTSAILATHVYGNVCAVEEIQRIADKYNLKVIYDGAHAFNIQFKGNSVFNFGDVSTLSFHATKLFHTIEGGAIITKDKALAEKLYLYRSFGHIGDEYHTVGINGKNSEFHAAMGLTNLPHVDEIITSRKEICQLYKNLLKIDQLSFPLPHTEQTYNYSYFPVIFQHEDLLLGVKKLLAENEINTRRYFYPSLNQLPFLTTSNPCPISEDISRRVLCLPLYQGLDKQDVEKISSLINQLL